MSRQKVNTKRVPRRLKKKTGSAKLSPLPRPIRAFIDETGSFIEHWGFKRIQGEIWGLAYLKNRPVTATEIAGLLGVSKALVSLAMAELLEYRVLLPIAGEDGRAQKLVPNENLGEAISGVLILREKKMLQKTTLAIDAIKNLPVSDLNDLEIHLTRVDQLRSLVGQAEEVLAAIVAGLAQRI